MPPIQSSRGETPGQYASGEGNVQLEKFFIHALKNLYCTEKHYGVALEKMLKAISVENIKEFITVAMDESDTHAARLEDIFLIFGLETAENSCPAMAAILKEDGEIIQLIGGDSMTRNAAIIITIQKAEHYRLATYQTMINLAVVMGVDSVASILRDTLEETKRASARSHAALENGIEWREMNHPHEDQGD